MVLRDDSKRHGADWRSDVGDEDEPNTDGADGAGEPDERGRSPGDEGDGRDPDGPFTVGRRTVLRALGATGAAGALADPVGAGGDRAGVGDGATTAAAATGQDDADLPPGTEGLLAYVEANYGDQLSDEQLDGVQEGIAGNLRAAAAVDEVDLDYTTGPAFTFTAYRGDDRYAPEERAGPADEGERESGTGEEDG